MTSTSASRLYGASSTSINRLYRRNSNNHSRGLLCNMALLLACICLVQTTKTCVAFAPSHGTARTIGLSNPNTFLSSLYAARPQQAQPKGPSKSKKTKSASKSKYKTIGEMMKAMEKNPDAFVSKSARAVNANGRFVDGKKKPKRSRKRVERPKQRYIYASQRKALDMMEGGTATGTGTGKMKKKKDQAQFEEGQEVLEEEEDDTPTTTTANSSRNPQQQQQQQQQSQKLAEFYKSLGLNPATQVADALVSDSPQDVPKIIDSVRIDGDEDLDSITSNSFAYVLYKPVGWSILGENKKKNKKRKQPSDEMEKATSNNNQGSSSSSSSSGGRGAIKRVRAYDEQTDDFYFVEYDDADVLAVLTPDERAQLLKEGGLNLVDDKADIARGAMAGSEWDDGGVSSDEFDDDMHGDEGSGKKRKKKKSNNANSVAPTSPINSNDDNNNNVPRMTADINTPTRSSLINWLKQQKANEGTPIKGGKNWVALAGATEIDDSGLVLLCPRDRIDTVHVDRCSYLAVVGNGKKMVSRSKLLKSTKTTTSGTIESCDDSTAQIDILSRVKRGRDSDPVMTVAIDFPDGVSTCSHATLLCQDRFGDGVRGDGLGDALDRRASRRLVHCESMSVTSLVNLDNDPVVIEEYDAMPDDVANYVGRRDGAVFTKGSFLGRQSGLGINGLTNAYREINGAADGYPGWVVDRYDKWLFVQHDNEEGVGPITSMNDDRGGPLPSLHDGYTSGVYYLPTKADRSIMGSEKLKPKLLEGQDAPEFIPITENGIEYLVNMGESFSTGIFLDQRLQRAWLADQCNEDTRVLNCFAHTGAFSVAAATTGAKTVSLDLDKKWLDRIRPQMEANGIMEWDGQHDCIYGDCFDWLARLAKRGEQFDIVILDPPSTSVGKKKKRWSVKNDMDELVALAAPLVKRDGLLFTTTNSASLRPDKFAKMCKKGLMDAGITNPKLERVSPMPSDFLSIGSQPVKNLVWRIP